MDQPIKIKEKNVARLDSIKDALEMTRQRLANNLLYLALNYVEEHGYGSLISLTEKIKNQSHLKRGANDVKKPFPDQSTAP